MLIITYCSTTFLCTNFPFLCSLLSFTKDEQIFYFNPTKSSIAAPPVSSSIAAPPVLSCVQLSKNITKCLSFVIIHIFSTHFKGRRGLLALFHWHFLQGLSFLYLEMTLPFEKLCYAFEENLFFSVTIILLKKSL